VQVRDGTAIPDTLLGTDSHTTMVNGVGVLGWGVGGIEAEASLLGQPMYLPWPEVLGVKFTGKLPTGTTATDLVLTMTELFRKRGVVNKFIEFCGSGLSSLSVPDRATLSNMTPEYGATASLFPVDAQTLLYLEMTGREPELISLVERYTKAQQLFRTDDSPTPTFDELIEVDLGKIESSLAGPKRPQDRTPLSRVWDSFIAGSGKQPSAIQVARFDFEGGAVDEASKAVATAAPPTPAVEDGSVVIAAITSCTNTSNPSVMVAAGLLAKKAVERGLKTKPTVKTSLAPGSRVVTDYLDEAGLTPYLEALGFYLTGYGCQVCIGNSGPLSDPSIETAVRDGGLNVVAVLSGNRNFEGRIHPLVRSSYLASPPLVVAFALAGTVRIDLTKEPLGRGSDGKAVYLRDVWPSPEEVDALIRASLRREMFEKEYARISEGDEHWQRMAAPTGASYAWDPRSTYVKEPPFFQNFSAQTSPLRDIEGARTLLVLGDSVTTDHISPAGSIAAASPAGQYLIEHDVVPLEFNSYGTRRGNHEVLVRGTFANIRLRNKLVPEKEGWWTKHLPSGEVLSVYDAAMRYQSEGVPLIVIAGKEYGSGSSRDWAAKGPALLGVRAVMAESYERIHRSNLVGMGILPLQFEAGESAVSLGLTGEERFTIRGVDRLAPRQRLTVEAVDGEGKTKTFAVIARVDNATELGYIHNGGILPLVLRQLMRMN
jgi:aconitate hydratase